MKTKDVLWEVLCLTLVGWLGIFICGCVQHRGGRVDGETQSAVVTFKDNRGVKEAPRGLKEAIDRYWKARVSGDFKTAYGFEAPHVRFQFKRLASYAKFLSQGMGVEKVWVMNISKVDDNLYKVEMKLKNRVDDPALRYSTCGEKWIVLDRKYFHVIETLFGFID